MLLDLVCLTKCNTLLGVKTNVLIVADMITQNTGTKKYFIDNGRNFKSENLNRIRWELVKKLPANHKLLNIFGIKDRIKEK